MPKSILIIDDEKMITTSLARLLKREGYDVTVAQTAAEGLAEVQAKNIDLIVTDIRMPGQDGIEAIKNIRDYLTQNKKKPIPEVVITGYADEEKYKSALDLKVAAYIYKPFDIKDFLEAVKRNLNAKK